MVKSGMLDGGLYFFYFFQPNTDGCLGEMGLSFWWKQAAIPEGGRDVVID